MSRTTRNIAHANIYAREVAHFNYLRGEMASAQEIKESGYRVSNRQKSYRSRIVTNYDDLNVSAFGEAKYSI